VITGRRTTHQRMAAFKYNPSNGGPADTDITRWVEDRANELLRGNNAGREASCRSRRRSKLGAPIRKTLSCHTSADLQNVVDMDAISGRPASGLGVDPLGGAARTLLGTDQRLSTRWISQSLTRSLTRRFSFMTVDHDGRDFAWTVPAPYADGPACRTQGQIPGRVSPNDPDSDRHGIVHAGPLGLMNPNHYLAVAIAHIPILASRHRPLWPEHAAVGKTLVSSSVIDKVVEKLGPAGCPRFP